MLNRLIPAGLVYLSVASSVALAQTSPAPADGGKLLASGCFQCHGTNGGDGSFNRLDGVPQKDMLNKLNDMRTKPAGSSIMIPHALGYSSDDLYWITLYFSKLPKP